MRYELKLPTYSGPLEKLLELIEARELEITEISLGQVTDDFLKYLDTLKRSPEMAVKDEEESRWGLRVIADFIVVASRLIFIKSKSLLPDLALADEEESEIKDLEARLKTYRDLKPAIKLLAELWRRRLVSYSRPYFLNTVAPASRTGDFRVFYPGPGLTPDALVGSLKKIFEAFEKITLENQTIKEKIISLEERIGEVIGKMQKLVETSFGALSEGRNRSETIITFLAILHLAREQLLFLEQQGDFSDIIVSTRPKGEAKRSNGTEPTAA